MPGFSRWYRNLTPKQKQALVRKSKVSYTMLRDMAFGLRKAGADTAHRIDKACEALYAQDRDIVWMRIDRQDICETCRKCPLANR